MKKILFIAFGLIALLSCTATKDSKSARIEDKNEKKIANQAMVKNAVESGRFIVTLDKIYFTRGGMADLVSKYNYIIIDGKRAVINAAYIGKQFDIRRIAGINMRGATDGYVLTQNNSKGLYDIRTKVVNERNSFDLYLTIGKDGSCSVSISSMMIDVVRYRGDVSPIINEEKVPLNGNRMI